MTTCGNCGQENGPGAAFCTQCGSKLASVPQYETVPVKETDSSVQLVEMLRQVTLGEYEVLGEIGRGGMAFVYLAHDISLDRRVAIKVISPGLLWGEQGMAERFKREARTAAALSHPHIIPIHAVRDSGDLLYFVMKFVEGRTLGSVISELGRLPAVMVQTILSQVGGALGYAHRRGVIHRDIKPGNIMLDEEGWAVVTDFGVAKVIAAEALTQTGGTLGTPSYMSPEQCSGLPVTGASDQYALGVVAYEMVSGVKPFQGQSAMSVMYHHCNTPPQPLAELVPDCPPALAWAIMRMLEKEPENRWPTLEDMVAAIGAIAGEDSTAVRTQIVSLVKTGDVRALVEKFMTPSNPSPVRTPRPPTPSTPATPAPALPSRTPLTPATPTPPPETAASRPARRLPVRATMIAVPVLLGIMGLAVWRPWDQGNDEAATEASKGAESISQPTASPVAASIALTPDSSHLAVGDSVTLSASARDGAGSVLPTAQVSWTSSDPKVAEVSPVGVVTALGSGRAEVHSASGEAGATAVIVVEAPSTGPTARRTEPPLESTPKPPPPSTAVAEVDVAAPTEGLVVGQTVQLSAALRDASGNTLTGRSVTWTSDNREVATVDDRGWVTAAAEGRTAIRATSEGRVGTAPVTVLAAAVATVDVTPAQQTLGTGDSVRLSAVPRDPAGEALHDRSVRWTSSSADVARVSGDGQVVAVGPGSATITASSEGVTGSATITVPAPAKPKPSVEPRVAVEQVVEQYGKAIQDESLDGIRRVFPDLSEDQAKAWSRFFDTSTDLSVTLDQTRITVTGDKARASFRQRMSYTPAGPRQTTTTTVTMELTRRGEAWVITAVH